MRKVLSIFAVLILAAVSVFAQEQGKLPGGLHGGRWGATAIDTTPIVQWSFTGGMPADATEVGGVSVVSFGGSKVLKVDVVDGGSDFIYQTVTDRDEAWISCRFHFTDTDTLGWGNNEGVDLIVIKNVADDNGRGVVGIILESGILKTKMFYNSDIGGGANVLGTTEIVTDTWYTLLWHIKKATAAGADDGICNLKLNGVEETARTNWDNDAATYNQFRNGGGASVLDCIFYIDDVKLWPPEGLPD